MDQTSLGLTTPALVATVAYLIVGLTILFPFQFPLGNDSSGEIYVVSYTLGQRVMMLISLTVPTILSVYSLNCMMVGNCNVWSHVVAGCTLLWAILFIVLAYLFTVHR